MLVYTSVGSDDTPTNLWTRDALISVREFEKDVVREDDYQATCLAEQVQEETSTTREEYKCMPKGFLSVLDFFPDTSLLETMS